MAVGSGDDIEVTISVDDDDFESSMKKASDTVQGTFEDIQNSSEDGVDRFSANMQAMSESSNNALQALSNLGSQAKHVFEVLVAGEAVHSLIDAFRELSDETFSLEHQLGITLEAAENLNTALALIGSSSDAYLSASTRLTTQLRSNEAGLHRYGIVTRDASGALLDGDQVMQNSLHALMEYKEGTDRNIVSRALFGRSFASVLPLMQLTNEKQAEAIALNNAYGVSIPDSQTLAFQTALGSLDAQFLAVKARIAQDFLPILVNLDKYMREEGPQGVHVWAESLKVVEAGLETLLAVVQEVLLALVTLFQEEWAIDKAVLSGNWSSGWEEMKSIWSGYLEEAQGVYTRLRDVVQDIAGLPANTPQGAAASGIFNQTPGSDGTATVYTNASIPKPGEGKAAPDLKAEKEALAEYLDDLRERMAAARDSMEEQEALEQEKVDHFEKLGEEYTQQYKAELNIQKDLLRAHEDHLAELRQKEIETAQRIKDIEISILKSQLDTELAMRQGALDAQAGNDQFLNTMGVLSDQEVVAREGERLKKQMALEQEKFDNDKRIAEETYQNLRDTNIKILFNEHTTLDARIAAQQKLNEVQKQYEADEVAQSNQQLILNQKHNNELIAQNQKAALAANKPWIDGIHSVTSAFSSAIQGMINGTMTLRQALASIFENILASIMNFFAKWAAEQIIKALFSKATAVTTAAAEILASAATAGAAAVASTAAIPIVGPGLAAAAGVAAYTEAASYLGFLGGATAERGFDVPEDMGVYLHRREMVLPPSLADAVRSMVSGGGGQSTGGQIVPTFNVTTLDAKSFHAFLNNPVNMRFIAKRLTSYMGKNPQQA